MRANLIALAVVVAALTWNLSARRPLTNTDEAAWIFSTYYYRLAFIDHDASSKAWRHEDALDHPPLAKFYFGALLAPVGGVARSLDAKERWFERTDQPFDRANFVAALQRLIPARALQRARLGSTLAVLLACLALAALARRFLGPQASALAPVLLVLMPLTRVVAAQAISDGPLVALIVSCALSQAWLAGRGGLGRAAFCGVLIGLAFDTKISGALEVAAVPMTLLASHGRGDLRRVAEAAAMAALCALVVAVAFNPSLYSHPAGFVASMFSHRLETLRFQQSVFVDEVHPNAAYRLAEMLKALFGGPDAPSRVTGALTGLLAAIGLWGLPVRLREAGPKGGGARAAAAHAAAWIAASAATYRLRWNVYLFPAAPFICLLAAAGFDDLLGAEPAERLQALKRGAALFVPAASLALTLSTPGYWRSHPDLRREKLAALTNLLCGKYPAECPEIRRDAGR